MRRAAAGCRSRVTGHRRPFTAAALPMFAQRARLQLSRHALHVLLALGVAAALRVGTFCVYRPWRAETQRTVVLTTDAIWQHTLAKNLLHGNGFSIYDDPPYAPHLIVPPLCPVVLAALYGVFGVNPAIGVAYNMLLSIAAVALFYAFLRYFTRNRLAALIGCWLFAVSPTFVGYSNSLLMEQAYTIFMIAAFIAMVWFLRRPRAARAATVGLALGLLNLAKFSALYAPILLALPLLVLLKDVHWRRRVWLCAVMGLVFYACVLPWQLRNYTRSGFFVYTTNKHLIPLLFYMRDFRAAKGEGTPEQIVDEYVVRVRERTGTPFYPNTNTYALWQMERAYTKADYLALSALFSEELKKDPFGYAVFHFSHLPRFFLSVPAHEWGRQLGFAEQRLDAVNRLIGAHDLPGLRASFRAEPLLTGFVIGVTGLGMVFLVFVYIGMFAGIRLCWRRGTEARVITAFWLLWTLFIIMATGSLAHSRYLLPCLPALLALAAIGWASKCDRALLPVGAPPPRCAP